MATMQLQRTIKGEVTFEGTGLHTGRPVFMRLRPAPRDTGIVFRRLDKGVTVRANLQSVTDTAFATTISSGGARIKTVEHLLATAAGLGIDNMLVELTGPEVPIMDGSSAAFTESLLRTGIAKQASNKPYIRINKPVFFSEGQAEIAVMPYEGRRISYHIAFNHSLVGEQRMSLDLCTESFIEELAPARTFGFLKDVEYLKSLGLAKGGSLENAVLLSETGVLNASGLRFRDEFILHKMLDFVGDISLVGFPVMGHFIVSRSGHSSNIKFLHMLLGSPDSWEMVSGVGATMQQAIA